MDFSYLLKDGTMSVYECSKRSGIPYSTLSDILKGKTPIDKVSVKNLHALSKTLGYTMNTLYSMMQVSESDDEVNEMIRRKEAKGSQKRCVIVGGADIADYTSVKGFLRKDDYVVYCDSGLKHRKGLGAEPSLIVGDFDSYKRPETEIETITLPVAKDDTDTVFAAREGMNRGFREFLLIGVIGARLDHTLVNAYLLATLNENGCHGIIVDDYSEMELVASHTDNDGSVRPGVASVSYDHPYFSLLAMEGPVSGLTIKDAKFPLEDARLEPGYQFATSNEALPGKTAKIELKDGCLLLIKIHPGAAERHEEQ